MRRVELDPPEHHPLQTHPTGTNECPEQLCLEEEIPPRLFLGCNCSNSQTTVLDDVSNIGQTNIKSFQGEGFKITKQVAYTCTVKRNLVRPRRHWHRYRRMNYRERQIWAYFQRRLRKPLVITKRNLRYKLPFANDQSESKRYLDYLKTKQIEKKLRWEIPKVNDCNICRQAYLRSIAPKSDYQWKRSLSYTTNITGPDDFFCRTCFEQKRLTINTVGSMNFIMPEVEQRPLPPSRSRSRKLKKYPQFYRRPNISFLCYFMQLKRVRRQRRLCFRRRHSNSSGLLVNPLESTETRPQPIIIPRDLSETEHETFEGSLLNPEVHQIQSAGTVASQKSE